MSDDMPPEPKHSDDVEQQLLATVLHTADTTKSDDRSPYWRIYRQVDARHFYREHHRLIWRAIEAIADDTGDVWPAGVNAELSRNDQLQNVPRDGGHYVETELAGLAPPTAQGLETWADRLIDLYDLRRYRKRCSQTARAIDRGADLKDAKTWLADLLRAKSNQVRGSSMDALTDDYMQRLKGEHETARRFDTGIGPIDFVLNGGWALGRYYCVAARAKHGKTKLVVRSVNELVNRHNFTVDFWYTDGPTRDLYREFLAAQANKSVKVLERAAESGDGPSYFERHAPDTFSAVAGAMEHFKKDVGDRLKVYPIAEPHVDDIVGQARARAASADGPYCCVVDFIQNVEAGNTGTNRERMNVVDASSAMKTIRSELDCLVIALAQFNRGGAERDGLPKSRDLKGSGALEEDVNHLLKWHRPNFESDDADADENMAILKHALNRHGASKTVTVDADLENLRYTRYRGPGYD